MIMSVWQSRDPPVRILVRGEPMFFDKFEARLDVENGVLTYKGQNRYESVEGKVNLT